MLPGVRVIVPFGRGNRRCEGVVLSVEEGSETALKAVEQVLDEQLPNEKTALLSALNKEETL